MSDSGPGPSKEHLDASMYVPVPLVTVALLVHVLNPNIPDQYAATIELLDCVPQAVQRIWAQSLKIPTSDLPGIEPKVATITPIRPDSA